MLDYSLVSHNRLQESQNAQEIVEALMFPSRTVMDLVHLHFS